MVGLAGGVGVLERERGVSGGDRRECREIGVREIEGRRKRD